jgi:hypothetical protein
MVSMRPTNSRWVHEAVPLPALTFVTYEDRESGAGVFAAHCLELDIGGQGPSPEAAVKDLQEALELYLITKLDAGEDIGVRPAPKELWNLPGQRYFPLLLRMRRRKLRKDRKEVVFTRPAPSFDIDSLPA